MEDTHSTLLARLKDRSNEDAWRTFDQLYRPMLLNYSRGRGLSNDDAEDVTQQCVQVVIEQIGEYEHSGRFRTWLHTIIERKICDVFRKRRELQAESGVLADQSDSGTNLEETWDREWWTGHLRHCAAAVRTDVAENTYAAFVGVAIEERPAAVVAEQLGISVNQVYVSKHRVLERIRSMLIELTGGESMWRDL